MDRWQYDDNSQSYCMQQYDQLEVESFPESVRDNVVSDDVTITSSQRSDVTLGINFLFS